MRTAHHGKRDRPTATPWRIRSTSHPMRSAAESAAGCSTPCWPTAPARDVREVIAVIVDADGAASLALHRNRGFVDAGRLTAVGFKHGRWLDTVLLQRSLSPDPLQPSWSVTSVHTGIVVAVVGGVAALAVEPHGGEAHVVNAAIEDRRHAVAGQLLAEVLAHRACAESTRAPPWKPRCRADT